MDFFILFYFSINGEEDLNLGLVLINGDFAIKDNIVKEGFSRALKLLVRYSIIQVG